MSEQLGERKAVNLILTGESYRGPLPPPEIFEAYKEIDPRINREILDAYREQRTHRHGLEKRIVESEILDTRLGMVFALIVALTGFALSGLALYWGHPTAASIIAGADLGVLVYAFIRGRKDISEKKDVKKKEHPGDSAQQELPFD